MNLMNLMNKKRIGALLLIMLLFVSLIGCGPSSTSNTDDGDSPDEAFEEEQVEEEQAEEDTQQGAVSARVELEEYQISIDALEDVAITGEINRSFGQDIVALKASGEEVARITLEGNDGEEEEFLIVIPAEVLGDEHTSILIMGDEIAGVVDATNTKTCTITIYNE